MYYSLLSYIPEIMKRQFVLGVEEIINGQRLKELDEDKVMEIFMNITPKGQQGTLRWIAGIIKEKGR
jgi:hypothetical protein